MTVIVSICLHSTVSLFFPLTSYSSFKCFQTFSLFDFQSIDLRLLTYSPHTQPLHEKPDTYLYLILMYHGKFLFSTKSQKKMQISGIFVTAGRKTKRTKGSNTKFCFEFFSCLSCLSWLFFFPSVWSGIIFLASWLIWNC